MMNKVIENYVLKEQVGSGQYGKVFRSSHAQTNEIFAVKAIKQEKFKNVPKLQEFTTNEVATLRKLRNPNVIAFVEMLCTQNNVYLVYEFCNGGTLEDLIKQKKFLQEKEAIVVFAQIVNAFRSLFNNNILHRDLKPSNILLHDGVIKVADFGFCKTLLSPQDLTQTMVGSPIYMAPEILKGCNYNIKADIWSMGVVLFEMLFGFCPYEDKTIANLIGQIDNKTLILPKHINNISPQLEQLLLGMLTVNPLKRIEWNTLLSSPLFSLPPQSAGAQGVPVQMALPKNQQQYSQNQTYIIPSNTALPISLQGTQISNPSPSPSISLTNMQSNPPSLSSTQATSSSNLPPPSLPLLNLLSLRTRIQYQVKALNRVLEYNQNSEISPILSFLLMKSVSSQTEYLKGRTGLLNQSDGEVQKIQRFAQIVQQEIDFMQNCLDNFKEEIENLLKFNSSFAQHTQLKSELASKTIDFEFLKFAILKYAETITNNINSNSSRNDDTTKLRNLQFLNEIFNCFLLDEYFENRFDQRYIEIETPGKPVEINSATELINYKLEIAKSKSKPLDKYYIYA